MTLAKCSTGICVNKYGQDVNINMVNFPENHTIEECLKACEKERSRLGVRVTGCEHKHEIECHYHTQPVSKGNGRNGSTCCVYETGKIYFNY